MAARKPRSGGGRPRSAGGKKAPARRKALRVTARRDAGGDAADGVRLNRFLAQSGVCSRRHADELIAGGRVTVNGDVQRELGTRVDAERDDVRVDGNRVRPERPVYLLVNKPSGVLCTNARQEQRRRVIDLLPTIRGRVYTVGRLDADSEGLILVTNDGDFAQAMAHPRYGIPKTYAVLVRGRVTPEHLDKARGGVWLAEGRTGGARVRVERTSRDRTYLKVVLREGRNREIRRVFARLGYAVLSLKRVRIGPLSLHGLSRGASRFLSHHEVDALRQQALQEDPE